MGRQGRAFLHAWIHTPGHVGRALLRDGRLAAWGVIRPCRTGYKIGPLFADDRAGAEAVFTCLVSHTGGGHVFLDVVYRGQCPVRKSSCGAYGGVR
jgi:Acetyltransferase (GNAT) domain